MEIQPAHTLLLIAGFLVATSFEMITPANADPCPKIDVIKLTSWKDIDLAFQKSGRCNDDGLSEGWSEAIARQLVDRWDSLPELADRGKKNARLIDFVLGSIDSTLDTGDLDKMSDLAKNRCPASAGELCAKILQATREAKEE